MFARQEWRGEEEGEGGKGRMPRNKKGTRRRPCFRGKKCWSLQGPENWEYEIRIQHLKKPSGINFSKAINTDNSLILKSYSRRSARKHFEPCSVKINLSLTEKDNLNAKASLS